MGRGLCIIVALIMSIAPIERAASDRAPRSRIVAAMLERFARGYESFCFIGVEVSRRANHGLNYRRFALTPSFYERFVEGQLNAIKINQPGCPTPGRTADTCEWGCVVIEVFDLAGLGYPTPWMPWPNCDQERISIFRSHLRPTGKLALTANIYRDGLLRGAADLRGHNYLTVVEAAPCNYLIQDENVIE